MPKSEKLIFSEWVATAFLAIACLTLAGMILFKAELADKEKMIEWLETKLEYERQHCVCPKLGEER